MTGNHHDHLFRHTFGQVEHAIGLLRSILPPALARAIDWQSLTVIDGSVVDDDLREHQADLLFTVRIGRRRAVIYLLLEHKAQARRRTALQMQRYVLRILELHGRGRRLPLVIPIVIHHGRRPWRGPTDLLQDFPLDELAPPVRGAIRRLLPRGRFLLCDFTDADLAAFGLGAMTAMARLTLHCLQLARVQPPDAALGLLTRCAGLVRAVAEADPQRSLLAVFSYLFLATDVPPERLRAVLSDAGGPAAEPILMSTAERMTRAARAEASADLMLRLLRRRFGEIDAATEARVRAADEQEIVRLCDEVLTAPTLEQVFTPRR